MIMTSCPTLMSLNSEQNFIFNNIVNYNQIISECEYDVIHRDSCLKVQSIESFFSDHCKVSSEIYQVVHSKIYSYFDSKDYDFFVKLMEDIGMLSYHIIRSRSKSDYTMAIANFAKLRTTSSLLALTHISSLLDYFENLFSSFQVQAQDDIFTDIRSYLDRYDEVKKSPIFTKVYKFLMYAMSLSLFDRVGINFDTFRYSKVEAEVIKSKHHLGPDFIHCILDTLLYLTQSGYQCMVTGTLDPIYHAGSTYEKWFAKADDLKRQATLMTNPKPHGLNTFSFLADLKECIEKGDAIYKHATRLGEIERRFVRSILSDLKMLESNYITRRAAQKNRKAPFSTLVYGGSSVAKSTFVDILFFHYAKLFDLPTGSEFKYTRLATEKHWNNFDSTQHTIVLDDIAYMHPNIAQGGDPSLMEMLQIRNNIAFVPEQADLPSKGKTPMLCKHLIATTNTENLNAYAYFSCPLAVQRRLPWIIDISPKLEYEKDNCMFDGAKVPILADGEYPNYWNIVVKRVVPISDNRIHQKAGVVDFAEFTDINEFLVWFSKEAIIHENLQDKSEACSQVMERIIVCKKCYRTSTLCKCIQVQTQSEFVQESEASTFITCIDLLIQCIWGLALRFLILTPLMNFVFKNIFQSEWLINIVLAQALRAEVANTIMYTIGNRIHQKIGKHKLLISISTGLVSLYGIYRLINFLLKPKFRVEGGIQSHQNIGKKPISSKDERVNVWYKNDYQTTSFDVSSVTTSLSLLDLDQFSNLLLKNCVHFTSVRPAKGGTNQIPTRAFCLAGHIYMCNSHALPKVDIFELRIVSTNAKDGVSTNITVMVHQNEIKRLEKSDIAFFMIKNLPPKKDISKYFCEESFNGRLNGYYLARNQDGSIYRNLVQKIVRSNQYYLEDLKSTTDTWFGHAESSTSFGDCGSLLLGKTALGPMILGMHYVGAMGNNLVGSIFLSRQIVNQIILSFNEIIVQSGEPLLSAPSAKRAVIDLHYKSPVRYMEAGSAAVYGSFSGFRTKPKSSVVPTLINERMQKLGYPVKTGKPVMDSWEPWYIAMKDMVNPVTKMNNAVLQQCVRDFSKEILENLTTQQLKEVHVYDTCTAINGAAGVAYVDKINRNTSAGNPWKKSKKFLIYAIPAIGELHDPVDANPEILDRVDICIKTYLEGKRYMPNFCAHLKDEATTFKKIENKKTRVFTGAPFDWSIVVRKYLLSVIRLVQNNRFIFESGPGTIAQSLEWEEIREYLTKFGDKTMIAGDFEKFDKRMSSMVILSAFDIILSICKQAGYSEDELKVVKGIAEDTAFPLVDFNGDLIEFFGGNPSGHPLTVIINGLANCLYMRYVFTILKAEQLGVDPLTVNAKDFKKHVALMTYGDDNAMGVCGSTSWFNHTNIRRVLGAVDIGYTMADKDATSIPYITMNDVSFLKRTWRWDEDVQAYLCPLDHESIEKMLTMCVRSKTISPEEQAVEVISTAIREYFFYGKTIFEQKSEMFQQVILDENLVVFVDESTFPTWQELRDQFWFASRHVKLNRLKLSVQAQEVFIPYRINIICPPWLIKILMFIKFLMFLSFLYVLDIAIGLLQEQFKNEWWSYEYFELIDSCVGVLYQILKGLVMQQFVRVYLR